MKSNNQSQQLPAGSTATKAKPPRNSANPPSKEPSIAPKSVPQPKVNKSVTVQQSETKSLKSSTSVQKLNKEETQEDSSKTPYEEQLARYENYRSYLLQHQFLNASLKEQISLQNRNLDVQFTDRLIQVNEMVTENKRAWSKILRERAILTLEHILSIETKNYRAIFEKLDEFSDFTKSMEELLDGCMQKVWVDSGCSVDITATNTYIENAHATLVKIFDVHADFFKEYPLVQQAISEILTQINSQLRLIAQIDNILADIQTRQQNLISRKFRDHVADELKMYQDDSPSTKEYEKQQLSNIEEDSKYEIDEELNPSGKSEEQ